MSEAPNEMAGPAALTERERRMLAFERSWWTYAGSRDEAVRAEFGISGAEYHRALNALVDRPEALSFDAPLVRRLRRLRALRRADRRGGRLARTD